MAFHSLSARDDADFETTVKAAVQILTTSDSAVVHSAIRARILRGLIRAGAADADSTTVTTSASAVATAGPAQRRALVDAIIVESEDDLVAAEWEAVLRSIPAQDGTALTMTAAGTLATGTDNSEVSVWGPGNLSPAFLDAVATFGKACADPGNFQSALLALVTCTSFTEGVRRNLLAGGCNCSRANFLGACLGAAYGLDTGAAGGEGEEEKEKGVKGTARGIPLSWIAKTDKGVEVLEMTLGLFE